jgi:hypothetical protein
MVPGFTPPIKEPVGRAIEEPIADIVESPMFIVFPLIYKLLNFLSADPKL